MTTTWHTIIQYTQRGHGAHAPSSSGRLAGMSTEADNTGRAEWGRSITIRMGSWPVGSTATTSASYVYSCEAQHTEAREPQSHAASQHHGQLTHQARQEHLHGHMGRRHGVHAVRVQEGERQVRHGPGAGVADLHFQLEFGAEARHLLGDARVTTGTLAKPLARGTAHRTWALTRMLAPDM